MLKTLKKFFAFCGADNRKLFITSIWLGVISAICSAMRIPAAAIVIQALLEKNVTMATLWISLGIIVVSLIVTIAINMKATMLQTRAGYRACANKRIEIAEHLRYLPMGWFNDNIYTACFAFILGLFPPEFCLNDHRESPPISMWLLWLPFITSSMLI